MKRTASRSLTAFLAAAIAAAFPGCARACADFTTAPSTRWSLATENGVSWLMTPCGERFFSLGVNVLDGEAYEAHGVGIAGVKGFCGGFGQRALGAWGEDSVKHFVREAVDEALKLETALARIRTLPSVVLLHYSPVQSTVEGEPLEIYPFLGSSRLEDPIDRMEVSAVFHGHAHHGATEGRTRQGVPTYNVSLPLLLARDPRGRPFRVVELPADPEPTADNELTPVRARTSS